MSGDKMTKTNTNTIAVNIDMPRIISIDFSLNYLGPKLKLLIVTSC